MASSGSPGPAAGADAAAAGPGTVQPAPGDIALAPGARRRTVVLRNAGQRDVWISSHYPLDQVNPVVQIRFADSARPLTGCRLDLPAGEALLLPPGEERTATAVVVDSAASA